MTIEEYLAELERQVPRVCRGRFLQEARAHLHEAAAAHRSRGLSARAAEHAAVADFGPVELVARRVAAEAVVCETRGAAMLALAATALFVFPLYVVPENTLPPAQWATKPRDILILQLVTVALWAAAVSFTAVSAFLTWTRWRRLAAYPLTAASGAIAASLLVSAVLVVRWFDEVPATPSWPLVAGPLALAALAACALAAALAHRRRGLLGDRVVQD